MANINYFSDTVNYIVRSGDFSFNPKPEDYEDAPGFKPRKKGYTDKEEFLKVKENYKKNSQGGGKKDDKGKGGGNTNTATWSPQFMSSAPNPKKTIDVTTVDFKNRFEGLNASLARALEVNDKGVGAQHTFTDSKGRSYSRKITAGDIEVANNTIANSRQQLNLMNAQRVEALKNLTSNASEEELAKLRSELEKAKINYDINEVGRQSKYQDSKLDDALNQHTNNIFNRNSEGANKRAKLDAETNQVNRQDEKEGAKHELWQKAHKQGYVKTYGKLLDKEVGSAFDVAGDLYDTVTSKAGKLDKRIWKESESEKGKKLREKADNLVNLWGDEEALKKKQEALRKKADKADEDARTTRRARSIKNAVQTTGDVIGATKDTISSKSRARTLAERGLVGEKRRDARIAYALGDRSLFTKLAAGKSLGSKNAFTRFVGKFPAWVTYGRRENKNRKNYAKQLTYNAGFSEGEVGIVLGLLSSHDFSDNEEMHGEGWQYREYPELAKIVEDDKYEKMDADLIEKGEFSELDQVDEVAPEAPIVDSSEIAQHTQTSQQDEVSLSSILNKNYYEASPVEKKFQEMIARGFSQDEEKVNSYENFLEKFSESADTVRRV